MLRTDFDEDALGRLLSAHITERRQDVRGSATNEQANMALSFVARSSRRLLRRPNPIGREHLNAMIDALDDRAAPAFRWALRQIVLGKLGVDHWRIETCSLEDIAAAAENARKRQHGPKVDMLLLATLQRLAPIYEQATGKPFSHFKYKSALKTNESQSAFGRFATVFLTSIDPALEPSDIANGLDRLIAERRASRSISK